jgi:hypothetical protein
MNKDEGKNMTFNAETYETDRFTAELHLNGIVEAYREEAKQIASPDALPYLSQDQMARFAAASAKSQAAVRLLAEIQKSANDDIYVELVLLEDGFNRIMDQLIMKEASPHAIGVVLMMLRWFSV